MLGNAAIEKQKLKGEKRAVNSSLYAAATMMRKYSNRLIPNLLLTG